MTSFKDQEMLKNMEFGVVRRVLYPNSLTPYGKLLKIKEFGDIMYMFNHANNEWNRCNESCLLDFIRSNKLIILD